MTDKGVREAPMIEYDDGFKLTHHVPEDSRALDFTDGAGRRREGAGRVRRGRGTTRAQYDLGGEFEMFLILGESYYTQVRVRGE